MSSMGMENIAYCSVDENGSLVIEDVVAPGMENMSVISFFAEDEVEALRLEAQEALLGIKTDISTDEEEAVSDFEKWDYVINEEAFDFPLVFKKMPKGYNDIASEHAGEVLRLHYMTDAYEDGKTYEKYCTVYLPYGYDPEDTDTKYNVVYFQHGNGGTPNVLWDNTGGAVNARNMIDNMFSENTRIMDPCIIISPTYYLELDENGTQTTPDAPAGDGQYEGIPANYYKEIVEDLIPQVESQFNVYCEDFSEEGIIASREHRAFSGYSRGSICTWYLFSHDLPYFKYWMPMSATCIPEGADMSEYEQDNTNDLEKAYQYLKSAVDTNPEYDFFIVASSGGSNDDPGIKMFPLMKTLAEHEDSVFSFGKNPEKNNFYFICSDFGHYDLYMPYTLANAAEVFFQ